MKNILQEYLSFIIVSSSAAPPEQPNSAGVFCLLLVISSITSNQYTQATFSDLFQGDTLNCNRVTKRNFVICD